MIELSQQDLQTWQTNLQKTSDNIQSVTWWNGEIWSITKGTGEVIGDITSFMETAFATELDNIKKQQVTKSVTDLVVNIVNGIKGLSWDAAGHIGFMPISYCAAVLSTVPEAENGILWILQHVADGFIDLGGMIHSDSFVNWSHSLKDFAKSSFKRTWTNQEVQNIIDAWNSEHPDKLIREEEKTSYLGVSIHPEKFASLAQILIAMVGSIFNSIMLLLMCKVIVGAYAKMFKAEDDKNKVGLAQIFRSRITAFYKIKLAYVIYSNLISRAQANDYNFLNIQNINRISSLNRRIKHYITVLDKHEIPPAWYDSKMWHLLQEQEKNAIVSKRSQVYEDAEKQDDSSVNDSYIRKQTRVLEMLKEVKRSTVEKIVQDAKSQNKALQSEKNDVQ